MPTVTDPALLEQLNGSQPPAPQQGRKVSDPAILAQLNAAPMGTAEDMARSGATGLREGVESIGGMFGDAANMQGDLTGWIAGKLGAGEDTQATARKWGGMLTPNALFPSTGQIRTNVTDPLVNMAGAQDILAHTPQTTAGEYSRTFGQFAPGAAAGPGGLLRKTAMAAVPALASETAGQYTKGTDAEPYARFGAAVLGGGLAAGTGGIGAAVKAAAKDAPSAETVASTTNRMFDGLRDAGVQYNADDYANIVAETARDLSKGFRPVGPVKAAFEWVKHLAGDIGKHVDFTDIQSSRSQILSEARAASIAGNEAAAKALGMVANKLDKFEMTAGMTNGIGASKEAIDQARNFARATALKNIKQRSLNKILEDASTYRAGAEAGIKTRVGAFLRSGKGKKLFPPESAEYKVLLNVANGSDLRQAIGKLGFSGSSMFTPLVAGDVASSLTGIPGIGIATGLVGAGIKKLGAVRTEADLQRASAAIRSGKLNRAMDLGKAERVKAFVRALIATDSGRNSAQVHQPLRLTVTKGNGQ